jgi:hypothetical protein
MLQYVKIRNNIPDLIFNFPFIDMHGMTFYICFYCFHISVMYSYEGQPHQVIFDDMLSSQILVVFQEQHGTCCTF